MFSFHKVQLGQIIRFLWSLENIWSAWPDHISRECKSLPIVFYTIIRVKCLDFICKMHIKKYCRVFQCHLIHLLKKIIYKFEIVSIFVLGQNLSLWKCLIFLLYKISCTLKWAINLSWNQRSTVYIFSLCYRQLTSMKVLLLVAFLVNTCYIHPSTSLPSSSHYSSS